jgi:hypothetical protein
MSAGAAEDARGGEVERARRSWPWAAAAILVATLVFVPPVAYQTYRCFPGWHDAGNYARAAYSFVDFGHFSTSGDGRDDFFAEQHFEPFFVILAAPVRALGTPGYIAAITLALVAAAGYVFALGALVTRSRLAGAWCAAAFVANPYAYAVALSYHPETFGILFLIAFAYHGRSGHTIRAALSLALALLVKEDMWVYAAVIAVLAGRRDRVRQTAAYLAAALAYHLVAVQWIGGSLYPQAHYFNAFYLSDGKPLTKVEIARLLLGRWREFGPLLVTGPGLAFQATFLFIGVMAGWRYLASCAVMLLWLTYPGGPPRSNFAYYYSYAALAISFVILPFALVNLRATCGRFVRGVRAGWCDRWSLGVAMGAVVAVGVAMHLPGRGPEPIRALIDPATVWGKGPGVNVPVVRRLIARYLPPRAGSVLSQFYTYCAVPQRREMYVTLWDRGAFLAGQLKPEFVLLDLNADDPWVPQGEREAMVALLRRGDVYRPIHDAGGVLLYRYVGPGSQ